MNVTSSGKTETLVLRVGCHALALCLEQLRQGQQTPRPVRLELSRTTSQAAGYAYLRLSTYDERGWWEYNGLAVATDSIEPRSMVVSLAELTYVVRDAVATVNEFESTMRWDTALEIAGRRLEVLDDGDVPPPPLTRTHVQELTLPYPVEPCARSTDIGRVCIDPDLAARLASRSVSSADLVTVGDEPYLVARAAVAREATASPIIVAPLRFLAEGEEPPEPQLVAPPERRGAEADPLRQWLLALDPDTHVEIVLELLNSTIATVRQRAALHPALSDEILEGVLRRAPEGHRAAVVVNSNLSEATSRAAARDSSAAVRAALASNHKLPTDVLAELAADADPGARANVAGNPATPSQVLADLAADEEPMVRAAVAENPRTSRDVLRAMAADDDPWVCAAVAGNPACPPKVLRELLAIVPHPVLANPSTPRPLLTAGARANDPELRAQVARNPSTPARVLEMLANDPALDVVHAVAFQSAAPKRARKQARSRLEGFDGPGPEFTGVDLATPDLAVDGFVRPDPFSTAVAGREYQDAPVFEEPVFEETVFEEHEGDGPVTGASFAYDAGPVEEYDSFFDAVTDGTAAPDERMLEPVPVDWRSELAEESEHTPAEETEEVVAEDTQVAEVYVAEERDEVVAEDAERTVAGEMDETEQTVAGAPQAWPAPALHLAPVQLEDDVLDFDDEPEPASTTASSVPPMEIVTEVLDAIDAAFGLLRRVIERGDGAVRRLGGTAEPPVDEGGPRDELSALAARLEAIGDRVSDPDGAPDPDAVAGRPVLEDAAEEGVRFDAAEGAVGSDVAEDTGELRARRWVFASLLGR